MPAPLEAFRRAGIPLSEMALYAIAVDQTEPRIAHNADTPHTLASTAKIVTSLAALDILGPAYQWRTQAFLNGTLSQGVLTGDLLIVGGGDAQLTSEKLVAWFKAMQKKGLTEISGNIIVDRQRFVLNEKDQASTPKPLWHNPHHAYPDALVVDGGVLRILISSSPQGKQVLLEPALEGFEIIDQSNTVTKCASVKKAISLDFAEGSQHRKLVLSGDWAADCPPQKIATHPLEQPEFSREAVLAAWKKAGGKLAGAVVEAPPPPKAEPPPKRPAKGKRIARVAPKPRKPFLVLDSKPLLEAVRETNKWSNNLISRHLLLSLSPNFPREAATLPGALQVMKKWLGDRGFAPDDITMDNGSGLSLQEKARARALGTLLREAWFTRYDSDFKSSLPVVGVDGTMGHRLKRSDATGQALIKTGTLNETRSIAGYVNSKDGKTYAVVAIVNHAGAWRSLPALDAFIEWIQAGP